MRSDESSYFLTNLELAEQARNHYFGWLCQTMALDNFNGRSHLILARILHETEFYSLVEFDGNRESDGIRLRKVWFELLTEEANALGVGVPDYPQDSLDEPCTVLEMLIALALRLESDIMQDDRVGPRAQMWFWLMLGNLGISSGSDEYMNEDEENYIRQEISLMLSRQYEYNGGGGLFPLRNPVEDQREVELWRQAQAWLKENYLD